MVEPSGKVRVAGVLPALIVSPGNTGHVGTARLGVTRAPRSSNGLLDTTVAT